MAGPRDVTRFGVELLHDERAVAKELKWPVLLWEAPPAFKETPLLLGTKGGERPSRSRTTKPVFFAIRKTATNAFAEEITVGRTSNNDIEIDDNSISRFHAYFVHRKRGWAVVDANSSVGTWVNGKRLVQRGLTALSDGASVRFGHVDAQFLLPETFLAYMKKLVGDG
jgi:hypothetical protein